MTNTKIDPLVSDNIDLRDFAYMPLDVVRLRDSELATTATGDGFMAAVLLWCACWHQVPASSLPSDDRVLAKLAGYGRDVEGWLKIKEDALRGFVMCTDGRFYHPVIADKALEAAGKRRSQTERTAKATEARRRKSGNRNEQRDVQRDDDVKANVTITKGREGKGKELNGRDLDGPASFEAAPAKLTKEKPARREAKRPLPEGMALPENYITHAREQGISESAAAREWQKFKDHAEREGRVCAGDRGWFAAWRGWVVKAIEFNPEIVTAAAAGATNLEAEFKRVCRMLQTHRERGGPWPFPSEPRNTLDQALVERWLKENPPATEKPKETELFQGKTN
jgi:hypothetical protein